MTNNFFKNSYIGQKASKNLHEATFTAVVYKTKTFSSFNFQYYNQKFFRLNKFSRFISFSLIPEKYYPNQKEDYGSLAYFFATSVWNLLLLIFKIFQRFFEWKKKKNTVAFCSFNDQNTWVVYSESLSRRISVTNDYFIFSSCSTSKASSVKRTYNFI